jgi:predicted ATP-grasp superfamily ATP-dependent carboligase
VISRHHEELSRFVVPPVAPWDSTRYFLDKMETYRLAKKLRVPVPETHAPKDMDDIEDLCGRLDFEGKEWLTKIRVRLFPSDRLGIFSTLKGISLRSPEDLRAVGRMALTSGRSPPLVQEKIPSPSRSVAFNCVVDDEGRIVVSLSKRQLRSCPHEYGVTSAMESGCDEDAISLGSRFAEASGAFGFATSAFKRDPRDDRLKLIECNCRALMNSEIWRRSGLDMVYILYCLSLGRDFDRPRSLRLGLKYTNLVEDLTLLLTDRKHYPVSLDLTREIASHYVSTRAWALMSGEDPLPFLIYASRRFRRRGLRSGMLAS